MSPAACNSYLSFCLWGVPHGSRMTLSASGARWVRGPQTKSQSKTKDVIA